MPVRIKIVVVAFSILLCFAIGVAAQEKYGTVYFYRDRDTADYPPQINVLNPEAVLHLDGQEFLSLGERTFIGFRMPVGSYRLSMTLKGKGVSQRLWVNEGMTYYVHITQVMYPTAFQTITQDDWRLALDVIRKSDALKAKKVSIFSYEMIRANPTKKKS